MSSSVTMPDRLNVELLVRMPQRLSEELLARMPALVQLPALVQSLTRPERLSDESLPRMPRLFESIPPIKLEILCDESLVRIPRHESTAMPPSAPNDVEPTACDGVPR